MQQSKLPQWYRTLWTFLLGAGFGAIASLVVQCAERQPWGQIFDALVSLVFAAISIASLVIWIKVFNRNSV